MRFSQYAGTAIVPTLSRLVLVVAFIAAGWNKFQEATYDAADANILRSYGVELGVPSEGDDEAVDPEAVDPEASVRANVIPASYRQDEATPDDPAEEEAAPPPGDPVTDPLPEGQYTALSLHHITLMCHEAGWMREGGKEPVYLAYAAALTELVGGICLLVGLLSRVWGLGLAIAMATAFYVVSIKSNGVLSTHPFDFATNIPAFNAACAQMGLFVLALGVCLTGPGPLSIDRMLRGRSKPVIEDEPEDDMPRFIAAPLPPAPEAPPAKLVTAPAPTPAPAPAPAPTPAPAPEPEPEPELEIQIEPEHENDRGDPPPSAGGRPL